jgi:uncharacterized membrane protein YphA (DoxX/SURF4 family)
MSQPVPQAIAFLVLRVTLGIYMVWFGFERASWLLDATPIASQLSTWLADATPASRWYLERIIPGAPVFARLVPIASLVGGVALVFGLWTRLAAVVSLAAVLSLQFGAGAMFRLSYLGNSDGLLLVGTLLALAIAGHDGGKRTPPRAAARPSARDH